MFSRRHIHFVHLGILLFVFCDGLSAQVTKNLNIDSILNQHFTKSDPYNGVILIADKGDIVLQQAYGYRDIETGVALKTDDVFELASVSKQFTAMIVMMLQQDGKLNYEDPVEK